MANPRPLVGSGLKVAGYAFRAPLGADAPIPTDEKTSLDPKFVNQGLVSQEGVTVSPEASTEEIKEWNGVTVRVVKSEYGVKVTLELMMHSAEQAKTAFGDANVTVSDDGLVTIRHNAEARMQGAWVFELKDGDARSRIVLPNAEIPSPPERSFTSGDVVRLPLEITAYPDENGDCALEYIRFDAGAAVAA